MEHEWATEEGAAIERAIRHEFGIDIPIKGELIMQEALQLTKELDLQEYFEVLDTCR